MKYGKNYQYKSTEQAYDCGYQTGLTWNAPWVPGGPCVSSYNPHREQDSDWIAFCEHTKACNKAWLRGWKTGLEKKRDREKQNGLSEQES